MSMIRADGQWARLSFRYNEETVAKCKQLAYTFGVKNAWDPESKTWRFPIQLAGRVAMEFDGFGRDPHIEAVLQVCLKIIARRRLAVNNWDINMAVGNDLQLYAHQQEAVRRMCAGSVILAHDMGLGKTLASLVAARHMLNTRAADAVVVVAPVNTHRDWKKEAERVGIGHLTTIVSWSNIPKEQAQDMVVIADEAHYAQSLTAQRTQSFLRLVLGEHTVVCWCLTGTPMRNGKPSNLYPLLFAVDAAVAKDRLRFETRYCNAKSTHFTKWDTTGSSNLDELRKRSSSAILRRRKEECVDLPAKVRVLHQCSIDSKTNSACWKEFDAAYSKFLEGVEEAEIRVKGVNPEATADEVRQFRNRALKSKSVSALSAMRQAASMAKVGEAVTMARDAIEEGNQVVIFAGWHRTVEEIVNQLGEQAVAYHGGLTQKVRDEAYEWFTGGRYQAFVATPDSGGLGLNLQCASVVIMVDRPWSPGDVEQAEDRCHRIGTHWPVTVYWLQGFKVCSVVDEQLLAKMGAIEEVIEGEKIDEWEVLRKSMEGR